MTRSLKIKNVIRLLNEGVTHEELVCLCYDKFRSIYKKISKSDKKHKLNQLLIDQKEVQLNSLLSWIKKYKPQEYKKYQPYNESPKEYLLKQFEHGNVLLFIGEEIVNDINGEIFWDKLKGLLSESSDETTFNQFHLPKLAQAYEYHYSKNKLIRVLQSQFDTLTDEPQKIHHLIANISGCKVLVTTCIDGKLERALNEANRPFDKITPDSNILLEDEKMLQIYQLCGNFESPETLIITETDYDAFFKRKDAFSISLQGYLARKTTLFLGYNLIDTHFQNLYERLLYPLDRISHESYLVTTKTAAINTPWCEHHSINIIQEEPYEFLTELSIVLSKRTQQYSQRVGEMASEDISPAVLPYKFLHYYEAVDTDIFFGRAKECHRLISLIYAHRLVVVYGQSGVGKTSLLLAGVEANLAKAKVRYETIYVRSLEAPADSIRSILQRRIPETNLPKNGSLVDFLYTAINHLDCPLIIMLDQFEEFFIRHGPQIRADFISDLSDLYHAQDLPIKIIFSLRADWLWVIGELENEIPNIFNIHLHLKPFSQEQARQAITAPVEGLGVDYEPELIEQILKDIKSNINDQAGSTNEVVMPPELQIVCNTLYDSMKSDEDQITLATYNRLGGTRNILQKYLSDALKHQRGKKRELAYAILDELVTSQNTKAVKTASELALMLGQSLDEIHSLLETLLRSRLIRVFDSQDESEKAYELAHEYLIQEMEADPERQKRKKIMELIKQEVENWKQFETLLDEHKLNLVDEIKESLILNQEELAFLLRSALPIRRNVIYWLNRGVVAKLPLLDILTTSSLHRRDYFKIIHTYYQAKRLSDLSKNDLIALCQAACATNYQEIYWLKRALDVNLSLIDILDKDDLNKPEIFHLVENYYKDSKELSESDLKTLFRAALATKHKVIYWLGRAFKKPPPIELLKYQGVIPPDIFRLIQKTYKDDKKLSKSDIETLFLSSIASKHEVPFWYKRAFEESLPIGKFLKPETFNEPEIYELIQKTIMDNSAELDNQAIGTLQALLLEPALANFGFQVKIKDMHQGPSITQFSIHVGDPTTRTAKDKITSIINLSDDLKLALIAESIWIKRPTQDYPHMRIEIPNKTRKQVLLSQIIKSSEYLNKKTHLKIILGYDVYGKPKIVDITQVNHLLIAGTTKSGKSVFLNSIISGLLCSYTPKYLRLALIDPKGIELHHFDGIPHLIAPVATEVEKIHDVFNWAKREVERRLKLFHENKVDNLNNYNKKMYKDDEQDLPYIVIIVDEFSTFHISEDLVYQITETAHQAGLYLILSTQRPTTDILPRHIKESFDTRIAFKVISQVDSRIILDTSGAERLLGEGDMLYRAKNQSSLERIQGAYISEAETEEIIDFWKNNPNTDMLPSIT